MLALILAGALTQADPQAAAAAHFMRHCDRPQPTAFCAGYISGFVDSAAAHLRLAKGVSAQLDSPIAAAVTPGVCLPETADLEPIRAAAVEDMRRRPAGEAPYMTVLATLVRLFPCRP